MQLLNSALQGMDQAILCGYRNATATIQVVRIKKSDHLYSERVVFPHDWFLFEAPSDAQLEIDSHDLPPLALKTIACSTLQIREPSPSNGHEP